MNEPLLDVRDIGISFGGLRAVADFSLQVPRNSLYGLIGPNGAGKTTIFNLLTGVYRPGRGSIHLRGQRIDGRKPYEIAQAGLSRTFQNVRLFGELSVLDNLRVACHMHTPRHGLLATLLRTRGYRQQEKRMLDKVMALLSIFKLEQFQNMQAKNLAYGNQRRLEILRAIATDASLILLDEPAAGLNPAEKESLADAIRQIRDQFNLTILLIEHDMRLVMKICECITVLDHGEVIARGCATEIQTDPNVIEAYLGDPGTPPTSTD